ncbi:YciI family protein [Acidiphilium sp.]|uniref:YciI family protein n=1 Tax=Acidiphilium sp. TaxID=527 RepID=UPI003D045A00
MQFILIAHDNDDGLALRKRVRPDHIAYLTEIAGSISFGGPLLDDDGNPCGSMIVYDTPDRETAVELIANDPYSRAGLFARTELMAFRTVVRDGAITP